MLDQQQEIKKRIWNKVVLLRSQKQTWVNRCRKLRTIIDDLKAKHISELKEVKKKLWNVIGQERTIKKRYYKEIHNLKDTIKNMQSQERFFTHGLTWTKANNYKVELMLRAVTTYQKLADNGTVTYHEIIYLSVGYEKEFFTREDVEHRFGADVTYFFNKDIKKLMRAGYIKKVVRKPYLYLTVQGRNRLQDIVKYMFTVKHKNYFTSYNPELQ